MSLGVLIIDDEEGVRRAIKRILEEEGYLVFTAKDGREGISIVKENPHSIDVIICDLIMPGIDGLKTIEEINKLDFSIAKIVLTGYGTIEMSIKAIELGVDGFITKPFENKYLKLKVRESYIKRRMKQFIQPDIFQKLVNEPQQLLPRLSHITVLFSDIRGFSELSSKIHPRDLAELVNRHYFEPLSEIIAKYSGIVDKYIGDCIMAIFGAPCQIDRHEESAVLCAMEMVERLKEEAGGFRIGIGISTGYAVTGVFGSLRKREYTAFGIPVNYAARLQKIAGPFEILITEETKAKLGDEFSFEKAGMISLREDVIPTFYYRFKGYGKVQ